jgi:SnoaL-like polyketide cyclase
LGTTSCKGLTAPSCCSRPSEAEVSIHWTLRGQHTGPFLGIQPTGNYVTVSAIGIYTGGEKPPID